jgi:hypothetical protein
MKSFKIYSFKKKRFRKKSCRRNSLHVTAKVPLSWRARFYKTTIYIFIYIGTYIHYFIHLYICMSDNSLTDSQLAFSSRGCQCVCRWENIMWIYLIKYSIIYFMCMCVCCVPCSRYCMHNSIRGNNNASRKFIALAPAGSKKVKSFSIYAYGGIGHRSFVRLFMRPFFFVQNVTL